MNIDTHTKPSNKIIRTTTVTIFLMVTSRVSPTFFFPALNWTLWLIKYLHSFNLQGHWQHLIIIERERERERDHSQYFELPDQNDNRDNDSYWKSNLTNESQNSFSVSLL